MKRLHIFSVLLLSALAASAAPAPMLIPFQGRLTDQQARPYTSGQYTITFILYDQAVGGSPLWTETHQRVGVINGMVNVFLGSITTLNAVNFSETRHLGITIDADNNPNTPDPEMVPRQMIIPSFWSKYADNSAKLAGNDWSAILVSGATNPATAGVDGGKIANGTVTQAQIGNEQINTRTLMNGAVTREKLDEGSVGTSKIANGAVTAEKIAPTVQFVPPGTIVAFAGNGNSPPAGWLFCNGDVLTSAAYTNLFAAIGTAWGTAGPGNFKLPDLRGLFLRGRNWGRSDAYADPDISAASRPNPWGGNTGDSVGSYQGDNFQSHAHAAFTRGSTTRGYVSTSGNGFQEVSGATGGSETRPKNANVNYIIKY